MPTNADIQSWLAANPNASDQDIANAMNQYGVNAQQVAQATGGNLSQIQDRYMATNPSSWNLGNIDAGNLSGVDRTGANAPSLQNGVQYHPYSDGSTYGNVYNDIFAQQANNQLATAWGNGNMTPAQRLSASSGGNPASGETNLGDKYSSVMVNGNGWSMPADFSKASAKDLNIMQQILQGNPNITKDQFGQELGFLTNQQNGGGQNTAGRTPGSGPGMSSSFGGAGQAPNWSNYSGYTPSPYLTAQADDITRRVNQDLTSNMNGIQSDAVGVGGLGGDRQGIAQGVATRGAMDSLSGQLANLYGTDYTNAANRNLQRYGVDLNNYQTTNAQALQRYGIDTNAALGYRGQDITSQNNQMQYQLGQGALANQKYGLDLTGQNNQWNYNLGVGSLANQQYGMDQNFYTAQRGQDLAQLGIGANIYDTALKDGWTGLDNASQIYNNAANQTTSGSTTTQQGGGTQGAFGGSLGAMQFGKNMGWW